MRGKRHMHFWEINSAYLWMKNDFWKFVECRKNGSWSDISRNIGIEPGTFRNYHSQYTAPKKGQFMPVSVLLKLSEMFNVEKERIEEMKWIRLIKGGQAPKSVPMRIDFPIDFVSKDWAGLVGAFLSEGNLNADYNVSFCNKDREVMSKYIDMAKRISRDGINLMESHYICSSPSVIGKTMSIGLGFKPGNKMENDVGIPQIYMNSNDEIKCCLLSWLFTGDGWVTLFNDHLGQVHRAIGICFGSKNDHEVPSVLRDTRTLLYGLGIRCSKYIFETHTKKSGRIAHSCKIHIKGKRNFIIFRDKIKFQSSKKQKIINDSIESFKKPKLGNNESLCMILKACLELHKDGREINKHTIAEKTTLNEKWIETRLKTATERKLMRVIGEGKPISRLGGRKPYIYEPLKSIEAFLEEYR